MSTYLVGLVISDFECKYTTANAGISGSVDVSICGRAEAYGQLESALTATVRILESQEKYFGLKYPLTKCGTC
jgi:aminopeptidase N